jgi:hypothetical protein
MAQLAHKIADDMDSGFEQDIREFKTELCDETQLIIDALQRDFSDFVRDPILDVGAGFQAISIRSFPGHDITLLDKIAYDMPSATAKRVTADFFDYTPPSDQRPQTLLFCHVLQYLDDDLAKLYRKIESLTPARIITVVNDNDGAFGDAVAWARRHMPVANPEVDIPMSSIGYRTARRTQVTATLACRNFKILAYQFGRLILDLPVSPAHSPALRAHLESLLAEPVITINQTIIGYEK